MIKKNFRFSLDPLLRVRRIKEKEALGFLAKVLASYNVHQNRILSKRQEIESSMGNYVEESKKTESSERAGEKLEADPMEKKRLWDRYFKILDKQIEESQKKALDMRPELEREQKKVQVAQSQRKVLELLKEKERAEYMRKMRKKEGKELAELNQRNNKTPYSLGPIELKKKNVSASAIHLTKRKNEN